MSWSPKFIEVSENIKYVQIHKNHYKISVNINKESIKSLKAKLPKV